MDYEYRELLSKPEELEKRKQEAKKLSNVDLLLELHRLYCKAGSNHPLTKAYSEEYNRRNREYLEKLAKIHEEGHTR